MKTFVLLVVSLNKTCYVININRLLNVSVENLMI